MTTTKQANSRKPGQKFRHTDGRTGILYGEPCRVTGTTIGFIDDRCGGYVRVATVRLADLTPCK